jgi:hypothetical protein
MFKLGFYKRLLFLNAEKLFSDKATTKNEKIGKNLHQQEEVLND